MFVPHVYMGDIQGKTRSSWRGLEFRMKCHPNRERGQGMEASQGRGSDSQERWMGSGESRWEVWQLVPEFVWVPCWCLVSSPVGSQSSAVDEAPGRGSVTIKFFLEDLSLGREGEFRESLSLYLLFFKCLQLNKINAPKHRILTKSCVWGWQILSSQGYILG